MEKDLVKAVQARLKALDWYLGDVDGGAGAMTRSAVIDFKAAHGFQATAFVGEKTLQALFGSEPKSRPRAEPQAGKPAWLVEAERLKGTRETPGAKSNPVILDWADDLDLAYSDDAVPWCGLFVAHCIRAGAPDETLPDNPLGARRWLTFGRPVEPQPGAILVFWRGAKDGWSGHVGFYAGEDATSFYVLSGNQSDAVTVARIAKSRLLGTRWPLRISATGKPVRMTMGGALSSNEA